MWESSLSTNQVKIGVFFTRAHADLGFCSKNCVMLNNLSQSVEMVSYATSKSQDVRGTFWTSGNMLHNTCKSYTSLTALKKETALGRMTWGFGKEEQ